MTSQIDPTVPVFATPTTQSVRDNFNTAANEITALQNATVGNPFLSLQGGRMDGPMYLYNDPTDAMMPATKGYVDAGGSGGGGGIPEAPSAAGEIFGRSQGAWVLVLGLGGGTLTGPLTLSADPVNPLDAATKEYVDTLANAHLTDAPNDAFFYARHAGAWSQVLALTGGVLSGSLGVGVTPPADISTTIRPVMAGQATVANGGGVGFNSYIDTTGTYRYLAAGAAGVLSLNQSSGTLALATAPSGAADAAISWSGVYIDAKGDLTLTGAPTIPTDTSQPVVSAFAHVVGLGGSLTHNAYLSTSGWKYLAAGYAGVFQLDTSGSFHFYTTAGSGAAGGAISLTTAFSIDRSGNFSCAGSSTISGNLSAQNGTFNGTVTASAIVGTNVVEVTNGVSMGVNINMPTNSSIFWPSSWQMVVNASGELQFGHAITFNPDGNINGSAITVTGNANIAGVSYATAHVDTSDQRLKEHFAALEVDCLNILDQMTLQQFDWKAPLERQHISCGFTAQDVRSLIPEAVSEGREGLLGVDLMPLVAYCIGAIQQLTDEVAALKGSRA